MWLMLLSPELPGGRRRGSCCYCLVVMSDKKNQKKVKDAWVGAKKKLQEKLGEIAHDVKRRLEETII